MTLNRIIWLASFHKSGNTWLRAFLANYFAPRAGDVSINRLFDEIVSDVRQDFFMLIPAPLYTDHDLGIDFWL